MTIKVVNAKNGQKYYYKDGVRISKGEGERLLKKNKDKKPKVQSRVKGKCRRGDCPRGKICNISSGRCVNRDGRIGKRILAKSKAKSKAKSMKNCDNGCPNKWQVCNPKTGRCVNRDGRIGKKLTRKHPPVRTRPQSKKSKKRRNTKSHRKPKYKKCKEHQRRDPVTKRCRNIPGHKREHKSAGKYKKCKEHQRRDPVTKRCKNIPGYKRPRGRQTPKKPKHQSAPKWKDKGKSKADNRDCIIRSKLSLRPHQAKIVRYMKDPKHRAMLVVHGTGTGKTLTAVTISQCYLDDNPGHEIVFVGPSSLVSNFKKELRKYGVKTLDIAKKYKFYSFAAFLNRTKTYNNNKKDQKSPNWPFRELSLHDKMLIVDEAHNIRNSKSLTSRALVKSSFTADKILLLTATPFVNSIPDFIPLINMLHGTPNKALYGPSVKRIVGTKKQFIDGQVVDWITKTPDAENMNTLKVLLKNRVDLAENVLDPKDKPRQIDKVVTIEMSKEYYLDYVKLMDEQYVKGLAFTKPEKFYHGYRRAVNKAGLRIEYYSTKIKYAIPIIKRGKSLIYSNWIGFGVKPITDVLQAQHISYRVFTGATPVRDRQTIVNEFNNNKFDTLVVTKAGGEGLDLKGVRNVIVLDPTWNEAGMQQLIGRAIRYQSHSHLPLKDRVVNVYLLALVPPADAAGYTKISSNGKRVPIPLEPSGDQILYEIIERKRQIGEAVITLIRTISV